MAKKSRSNKSQEASPRVLLTQVSQNDGLRDHPSSFGERLKRIRKERGLTLQDLAERVGVTKSFLSQVENGAANPSFQTLRGLVEALDTPMFALFRTVETRDTLIVRKSNRVRISTSDPGLILELLSPDTPGINMEVTISELEPGAVSGVRPKGHSGEEFGLILRGRAVFQIGNEEFELTEGDSIWLPGEIPHRVINRGRRILSILSVVSPPVAR